MGPWAPCFKPLTPLLQTSKITRVVTKSSMSVAQTSFAQCTMSTSLQVWTRSKLIPSVRIGPTWLTMELKIEFMSWHLLVAQSHAKLPMRFLRPTNHDLFLVRWGPGRNYQVLVTQPMKILKLLTTPLQKV